MRSQRRRDLVTILHEGRATSQEAIVAALRAAGHDVTQATVSRDLRDVGATKVRTGKGYVYRLADEVPRSARADLVARDLERTLAEFALDIKQSSSLVVVRTAPGHAAAVARAIDLAGPDSVVGSVAGDDTIFVATASVRSAGVLVERWLAALHAPGEVAG